MIIKIKYFKLVFESCNVSGYRGDVLYKNSCLCLFPRHTTLSHFLSLSYSCFLSPLLLIFSIFFWISIHFAFYFSLSPLHFGHTFHSSLLFLTTFDYFLSSFVIVLNHFQALRLLILFETLRLDWIQEPEAFLIARNTHFRFVSSFSLFNFARIDEDWGDLVSECCVPTYRFELRRWVFDAVFFFFFFSLFMSCVRVMVRFLFDFILLRQQSRGKLTSIICSRKEIWFIVFFFFFFLNSYGIECGFVSNFLGLVFNKCLLRIKFLFDPI